MAERIIVDFTPGLRRVQRSMEAFGDAVRLLHDGLVRAERREWEFPDALLEDEERAAIEARQMGRTLADIDDLPERLSA